MLKLSAGGAGMFMLGAGGLAVPRGIAGGGSGGGSLYIEAFPTSPLVTRPFYDKLTVPMAMPAANMSRWVDGGTKPSSTNKDDPGVSLGGLPAPDKQDSLGPAINKDYYNRYQKVLGRHQIWPGEGVTSNYFPAGAARNPLVYQIKLQSSGHNFTSGPVQPINSFGKNITPPGMSGTGTRYLPPSTIYGFNGTFPGPRINAEYGTAALVRFENWLQYDNGFDRMDFGAPNNSFLTHLHNGHTAPESDGQPHYSYHRFTSGPDQSRAGDIINKEQHYRAAWEPGEWVDQMYLGYPAGGDDVEKQSFFWFHDHVHGHTGANVYKGMVGLMPIYDPKCDNGDETKVDGYRLPGVRTNHPDGTFDVDYDIPMAFYDCRLDDGVTPHKDAHNGTGQTEPNWWGKTFFRHFPNHGFVGDIFTVNGTAYPVLEVKRRKYRLRFLDASISRIYEFKLMKGTPVAAKDLGYTGDELQGQYRLKNAYQCMRWVEVANEGGILPAPILRDSFELWPAKRREVVVDFGKYMDTSPTRTGEELYLCNVMKMTTGRMWDSADSNYVVPLMKIVIGGDAVDNSLPGIDISDPKSLATVPLRDVPAIVDGAVAAIKDKTIPTFELQRGSSNEDPETEWLINGLAFDPTKPLASPIQTEGAEGYTWRIRNGGGGWVHPFHLHMEEHKVIARNGKLAPGVVPIGGSTPTPVGGRHPDDSGKEDVVALDPSEEVVICRRFRTFTGPYVAHCHNLAHEDHNMMFGWEIMPRSQA
jgi:FtsP/CotA-like multicopper oxidase with cupredoxin domain